MGTGIPIYYSIFSKLSLNCENVLNMRYFYLSFLIFNKKKNNDIIYYTLYDTVMTKSTELDPYYPYSNPVQFAIIYNFE